MNENMNAHLDSENITEQDFNLDSLEMQLEMEVEEQLLELGDLEEDFKKIGNPESLGNTVMNVVWEQFINQVGVIAGEDFIKENKGLKLDLRDSAHIQTTENFGKGKIASHNDKIDYQKRYDDWQSNFQHNDDGSVKTHKTRSGKEEATLVSGARKPFDDGRPTGSVERNTDMDHTVSAGEIIRDAAANAHLDKKEQITFANSENNLNEMNASHNRSKADKSTSDWLDIPNANGQRPEEIFDNLSPELQEQYRKKDKEARTEYERVNKEGEKRSVETGKQSQKEETFRIGGKALRAAVMGLLAELMRNIIQKLVVWFKSSKRKLETLIDSIKSAIHVFFNNLKQNLLTAGNTILTSIATAIFGPIISMLKKAWIFLKQGWKSLKEAYNYIKDPKNKGKSFSILMLEVGKIIIAGVTAGGAIFLGEVIEKGLLTIPGFGFEIPFFGSLANILGIFLGAVVSGIVGATALNLIDKAIAKKQKSLNAIQQIDKSNEILQKQKLQTYVVIANVQETKSKIATDIKNRHAEVQCELKDIANSMKNTLDANQDSRNRTSQINAEIHAAQNEIKTIQDSNNSLHEQNINALDDLFKDLI